MALPTLIPAAWTPEPWLASALSLMLLIWLPSEFVYRRKGNIFSKSDARSSEVIFGSMVLNFIVAPWLISKGIGAIPWQPAWVGAAGLLLIALATALRYWAIHTLGPFFTSAVVIQEEQRVIRHGPFRWIRHPGYTGVLLFSASIPLVFANGLAALFVLVVHGLAMGYRIHVEERALEQAFGEDYGRYRQESWRLLPFVY